MSCPSIDVNLPSQQRPIPIPPLEVNRASPLCLDEQVFTFDQTFGENSFKRRTHEILPVTSARGLTPGKLCIYR